MNKTRIEWVKNLDGTQGYTWNPVTGCLNHTPDGLCLGGMFPCYAYKLANGRLKSRYLANENIAGDQGQYKEAVWKHLQDPFYPRFWSERLNDLGNFDSPSRGIFVCDMGELFGDWIPSKWMFEIMDCIKTYDTHRFYLLTKQPQNLMKFSPFPDNCWVGVTATDADMFFMAYQHLGNIEARVKYVSLEPLLGKPVQGHLLSAFDGTVNWVIIGAQTKPYKPPKMKWIDEIVKACDKAGVPVFLKDNLLELVNYEGKETEFAFNKDGFYRQEIPD